MCVRTCCFFVCFLLLRGGHAGTSSGAVVGGLLVSGGGWRGGAAMDILPTSSSAAGLLGCSSTHACVYLTQVLQETCQKVQESTGNEVLLAVTMVRHDGRNAMLAFCSNYVDGDTTGPISTQLEHQVSVAVDGVVTALQDLAVEKRSAVEKRLPMDDVNLPPSVVQQGGRAGVDTDGCVADEFGGGEGMDVDAANGGATSIDVALQPSEAGRADDGRAGGTAAAGGAATLEQAQDGGRPRPSPPPHPPRPPLPSHAPRSLSLVGSSASRGPSPSPRSSPALPPVVDGYTLPKNFTVPGLTVPPARILMATGRGSSRREPPPVKKDPLEIPDALVQETISELSVPNRPESLRKRLVEFSALYKFVVDTLVERSLSEPPAVPVSHPYPILTPDALRDLMVKFNLEDKAIEHITPLLKNSHHMKTSTSLAVVLCMKALKDPFFLWLLGLFSRGAMAPFETTAPSATLGGSKSRKRSRSTSLPPTVAGSQRHGGATVGDGAAGRGGGVAAAAAPGRETGGRRGGAGVGHADSGSWSFEAVVKELRAGSLMADGRVVATADLHPEWSTHHNSPTPLSVVPCFLRRVADGCGGVTYPFGQDPILCLEKGNPASEPVPLQSISPSYRIAWPVESIGYVQCSSSQRLRFPFSFGHCSVPLADI